MLIYFFNIDKLQELGDLEKVFRFYYLGREKFFEIIGVEIIVVFVLRGRIFFIGKRIIVIYSVQKLVKYQKNIVFMEYYD